MGMISPLSLACTSRMAPLRVVLSHQTLHLPSFDIRPNGLSDGVTQRLCFVFSGASANGDPTWSAGYRRWLAPERQALLPTEHYTTIDGRSDASAPPPKFGLDIEKSIREKLGSGSLEMLVDRTADPIYVHRIVRYFIKALDFVPLFIDAEGKRGRSDDYKEFRFSSEVRPFLVSLLNSSLFYWHWRAYSDGFRRVGDHEQHTRRHQRRESGEQDRPAADIVGDATGEQQRREDAEGVGRVDQRQGQGREMPEDAVGAIERRGRHRGEEAEATTSAATA
jgi:hypothetical protein